MNKNGFTLIEIIVSIIIITSICLTSIIFLKENNSDNISKKILEAANIFVEVEKDENGSNYLEEIVNGAKGVKIPVSMLVDKGYIEKTIERTLYKNITKKDGESYYVMFLGNSNDYCDKNEITSLASWMEEGKTIYLCNSYNFKENIFSLNKNIKYKVDLTKHAVSEEFYNNATELEKNHLTKDENGLYTFINEEIGKIYFYYRGAVENNYLKLGKDKSNNDLIWRILWLNNENKMKLVLDDEVNISVINYENEEVILKQNDKIRNLTPNIGSYDKYYILNPIMVKDTVKSYPERTYYNISYNEEGSDRLNHNEIYMPFNGALPMTHEKNIYFKNLKNWYNDTTLNEYSFITNDNNFCLNNYRRDGTVVGVNFKPSENFDCKSGLYDSNDYTYNSNTYSSPIGFLTYGDVIRAGLSTIKTYQNGEENIDLVISDSKNYLLSKNGNSYPLVDNSSQTYGCGSNCYYKDNFFYINDKGISNNEFYKWERIYGAYVKEHFTLLKPDNNVVYNSWFAQGDEGIDTKIINIVANTIKPSIIININNLKVSGTGEYNNPFVFDN